VIKSRKTIWTEYAACMEEETNSYEVLIENHKENRLRAL
jgi:hypothetical protein